MKRKIMSIVLCLFMVLSLMPIAAIAAEAGHRHCICGEADCTEHGGEQAWEPLPAEGVPTTPGIYYYYLDGDRTQQLLVDRGVTLNLCLNGYTLGSSIMVISQGVLNLCDCSGENSGEVVSANVFASGGDVNLYSGTCSVLLSGSSFHMYGGKLKNNPDSVEALRAWFGSDVTITGGEISNSRWSNESYCISIISSTATISNASINSNATAFGAQNCKVELTNVVFENHCFYSEDSNVVMSNCTITNSPSDGILLKGGTATLNNCTITKSSGAGVHVQVTAKLTMNGGEISSNANGVNIENGTFKLTDGSIKENRATGVELSIGNFEMSGGIISDNLGYGVNVSSGNFEMSGGTISGHSKSGVQVSNGAFEMSSGEISDNSNGFIYAGGGVTIDKSRFAMSGGKIINNTNRGEMGGGGVYVLDGSFEMTGGEISGNSAVNGGGIYLATFASYLSSYLKVSGGEIKTNSASNCGGGICSSPTLNTTTELIGGTISNNSAKSGGGMFLGVGSHTVSGVEIINNTATNGGGICFEYTYSFEISDSEISGNKATENGGGIYVKYLRGGKITGGEISGNEATGNGGGIYTTILASLTLGGNIRIEGNKATNGGALYCDANFKDKFNADWSKEMVSINKAVISGNTAIGSGGGIYSLNGNRISLNGGNISGNSAGTLGGGIYFAGTELNISGASVVGGNLANGVADDIYLPEGKKIHVIGELDNASVGIRMENPDTFTNNYSVLCGTADPASFFVSNDIQKTVALTPDNAEARLIDGHTHGDWSYTANDATLTATCGSDSYSETLTVSAQSEYVYDGTAKTASLSEQGGMLSDLRVALITYNTEDGKAPTAPGEYTASITVGGATASVSFEITIDGVDAPTPTQTEYFYTGEAQSCFNIPEDALYTATGNTQTEVGEYIVTLSLKDKEHLVWNDSGNTDDKVYTFVIKKAAVQEPSAPTSEIVYNGAPQSYFGNIDTSLYTAINNTQTNAGSYTVTLSLKDKTNRVWSSSGSNADLKFTFNIAKAPLSIAVKDQTVQINDSISSTLDDVTLSDPAQLMGGDALHGVTLTGDTSTATNIGHISLGAVVIKNGETDVTGNYKLESTNGNLTVLPEALPSTKTLTGIIVTRVPDKTAYNVGDSFNPAGMVVTATYSVVSGEQTFTTSDTVTTYTVTDGSNLPVGKAFVTIRYTENGVTKETTQAIHIHGNAESVSKTPATCTADGEMAHYLCGCGVRFLDENCTQPVRSADDLVIGALGHNMGDWISNGDDTHTRACKRDGCVYKEDGECHGGTMTCVTDQVCIVCEEVLVPADGRSHVWSEWETYKEAGFFTEEEQRRECICCHIEEYSFVKGTSGCHRYFPHCDGSGEDCWACETLSNSNGFFRNLGSFILWFLRENIITVILFPFSHAYFRD